MTKYKQYDRNYQKSWEKDKWAKGWLTAAPASEERGAWCNACGVPLRAHASDLKKHANTKQHITRMERVDRPKTQKQLPASFQVESVDDKSRDIRLAAFIAAHT